jgi:FKBP-type peptidyl-prolyl cis-trans isomerase
MGSDALSGFPEGLTVVDIEVGTGDEAVKGKTISVHYTGRLQSGQKFDSSLDRGQPFKFNLGARQVIQGWDLGFAGMKVGGKRQLTLAPEMGYGDQDLGVIPPNSTLVFDVELLGVR